MLRGLDPGTLICTNVGRVIVPLHLLLHFTAPSVIPPRVLPKRRARDTGKGVARQEGRERERERVLRGPFVSGRGELGQGLTLSLPRDR